MTANTILSDINEIYTGYVINDYKWYDKSAKEQYELRIEQATEEESEDARSKAVAMAKAFIGWAASNGYSRRVTGVWWTARPGSMSRIVGRNVDQKKNPTDILIQFSSGPNDGFLGLSAKASKSKDDIGFKNPGVSTVERSLHIPLSGEYDSQLQYVIKKYSLPAKVGDRKLFLRANPDTRKHVEAVGVKLLSTVRDKLYNKLRSMNHKQSLQYLLSDWMDAEVLYPPYIKVTGHGSREPYTASVMDPIDNDKIRALSSYKISFEKSGNETIGVKAGDKKIMKIRFKFESEKMASSLKLSGDPW